MAWYLIDYGYYWVNLQACIEDMGLVGKIEKEGEKQDGYYYCLLLLGTVLDKEQKHWDKMVDQK